MPGIATMIGEAQEEDLGKKSLLRIMDPEHGDLKTMWDPDNEEEVEIARKAFDSAKKKGLVGYRVDKKGGQAAVMNEFDPDAKAMIMAPAVKGG
jgi:hypothetical protein